MRCGSEAGDHGSFQWETGSLEQPEFALDLPCNFNTILLFLLMFLNGCGVFPFASSTHGLTWCSFPLKQAITWFFSFLFWWFPYVLVISFLPAPPCNLWPFFFHSCLHSFFLSSFLSTKKTLSLHLPLPVKHSKALSALCPLKEEMRIQGRVLQSTGDAVLLQVLALCLQRGGWAASDELLELDCLSRHGEEHYQSSLTASTVPLWQRRRHISLLGFTSLWLRSRAQAC